MPTVEPQTFYHVLLSQSKKAGDSPALKTLNAPDLSYTNFVHEVQVFMAALIGWGVKRGDKVIIQLPDGPEMFVALCAVSSVATAIPLNRHASAEEVSRILGFVKPKAVVVQSDLETSIRQAAQQNGARLIEITPERERGAGALHFTETAPAASLDQLEIAPEDIALIIHTSGTTGLPKMLEISHQTLYMENLAAVALWQRLAGDELIQVLNVLPMHLLFAIRLACASIMTGGSVVCVPGFNPDQFLGWLAQFQPNNLSATPPFLEQVVEAASRHPEKVAGHSLRYIATSSSPLHESLWAQLEQIFGVPIIQAYGMTEVPTIAWTMPNSSHTHRVGSVGRAVDAENTKILGEDGTYLKRGEVGEILVKPGTFTSYWNNPEATEKAFYEGWFRTGDEGYMDEDGFIFLTGRIKEVINAGGAKVSPIEVEDILKQHLQVEDVAVFGLPHPELGETVAAAVVGTVTERELRKFAAARLPLHKVPTHIFLVQEIPRNAAGKVPRNRLAELLGLK